MFVFEIDPLVLFIDSAIIHKDESSCVMQMSEVIDRSDARYSIERDEPSGYTGIAIEDAMKIFGICFFLFFQRSLSPFQTTSKR